MNYENLDQFDLLKEASFVEWVKNPTETSNSYWQGWIDNNPDKKEIVEEAIKLINSIEYPVDDGLTNEEIIALYQPIRNARLFQSEMSQKPDKLELGYLWKVAAILVVVVGAALFFAYYQNDAQHQQIGLNDLSTYKVNPKGVKSTFELPDGTMVKLNAESDLRYVKDTIHHRRLVYLNGEAYFDVFRDTDRPFSVVSGDISTTALGTSFSVRAFPDDDIHHVFLISGEVEVENLQKNDTPKLHLTAGMGASYSLLNNNLKESSFDYQYELGWKDGLLNFGSADQFEVIMKLERWYGVEITVENKSARAWDLTASFDNKPLEYVLNSLGRTEDFRYEMNDKDVKIFFKN